MNLPTNGEAAALVENDSDCHACTFDETDAAFFVGYLAGHFDTLICSEQIESLPLQIMNMCAEHQRTLRVFLDRANEGLNARTDLDEFVADFQAKWGG